GTGLEELRSAPSIFPNPTSDLLNIRWGLPVNGSYTWTIHAGDGRVLQQGSRPAGDTTFDIHQLSTGFYLLRVEHGDRNFNLPFIKTGIQ
ncbi:MAG: T9SS type A sorting domain-containing protein, partial [Flavobacteriales bacterium]|nr:T9SS type A sorting domain-containing protein [Flavobacteriales bacterium]